MTSTENIQTPKTQGNVISAWIIRLFKGILAGIGAITPGLSGGVLMVVFGIYEPLVRWLADIRQKFLPNLRYFLPIGIGGIIGVVAFSAVIDYAFGHFAAQFTWLFIGFITGTFPSLLKTAGEQGRKNWHWLLLALFAVGIYLFMTWMETIHSVTMQPGFWVWVLSGALTGLGLVVPGMSPSNFLLYLGLYQPMANGIKNLDLSVILPLILGVVLVIFLFARLVSWLFRNHHALMYHVIIGIVIGSTAAIIPSGVNQIGVILACALLFLVGGAASYGLAKLDEKHPHESLF